MELEDEAEALMAPRPCPKKFSSLAERQAYHDDLVKAGRGANAGGRFDVALARFTTAYPVLFKSSVLLSLVNMRLKLGEADLAVACYERLLSDAFELTAAERRVATVKLAEARSLVKSVTAICEPDQAKSSSTPRSARRSTTRSSPRRTPRTRTATRRRPSRSSCKPTRCSARSARCSRRRT